MLRISYRSRLCRQAPSYLTLTHTHSPAYTGRPYIFKTLIAPQTATFSIPTAAILLFPPSKISYDAIVQPGNTTERNSKDLPLESVANIAASSLCTWTGVTPPNNLWGCLLLKTPIETNTSYSARNLALRCANSAHEDNAVRVYIRDKSQPNFFHSVYYIAQRWI